MDPIPTPRLFVSTNEYLPLFDPLNNLSGGSIKSFLTHIFSIATAGQNCPLP